MPHHYNTGEDYLDHEKKKKKKFNYKEAKAELDRTMILNRKAREDAREKDRKERERREREAKAKKWAEEYDKKNYPQGVNLKRKAKVNNMKAKVKDTGIGVKLKHKAVKIQHKAVKKK